MKKFVEANLVELNITETAQGGKNVDKVDSYWTDKETGDLYASYASGGDTTGEEFTVVK